MTFVTAGIRAAVKEGDKVLLPEYGGTNLKLDGEECVFLTRLQTTLMDASRLSHHLTERCLCVLSRRYTMFRDEDLLGILK